MKSWAVTLVIFIFSLFFKAGPPADLREPQVAGVSQEAAWVETEIIIGGTVVLSRGVDQRIRQYQDVNYPWLKIAPLLKASDLAIVNLKSPFIENCPYQAETTQFCGQPHYVAGLTFAGVDLVSLAGNHIGDYGADGILSTIKSLDESQIRYVGAGANSEEAYRPAIIELNGLKVGFIAFNSVPGTALPAAPGQIGVAWYDEVGLVEVLGQLRQEADFIIAMPNWGPEYTHDPTPEQIKMGHFLIDEGVDLVVGDQAHWVQAAEEYQDGLIFYGLGNLLFDQMWSQETREGILIKVKIDKNGLREHEIVPVIIEDYAQPRLTTPEEKGKILNDIREASQRLKQTP